jgi:hypothetical protein
MSGILRVGWRVPQPFRALYEKGGRWGAGAPLIAFFAMSGILRVGWRVPQPFRALLRKGRAMGPSDTLSKLSYGCVRHGVQVVILSGAGTSRSEVSAESKDPCTFSGRRDASGNSPRPVGSGEFELSRVPFAHFGETICEIRLSRGNGVPNDGHPQHPHICKVHDSTRLKKLVLDPTASRRTFHHPAAKESSQGLCRAGAPARCR